MKKLHTMLSMSITLRTLSAAAATLICLPGAWAQSATTETPAAMAAAPSAQTQPAPASGRKKWSIYWGWNRSTYSNSDIHFWGADHDFTLSNVAATDLPAELGGGGLFGTYLNPKEMTIPQTNLRLAYQLNEDTAIALNLDHMKYVMTPDQVVAISGQIKGVAQGPTVPLATNFLNFEHTDGLNLITLEYEKQRHVDWFGPGYPAKVFGLVGAGIALPKSNVTLNMVGRVRNDEFHLAGYSLGAGAGLEVDLSKSFFFRTAYKLGYVTLPDVLTSSQGDKASHNFTYNELLIAFGYRF
jgi:hypothetical protein